MASTNSIGIDAASIDAETKTKVEWKVQHKNFKLLDAAEKEQLAKSFREIFHFEIGESIVDDSNEVFWITNSSRIISFAFLVPKFDVKQLKYDFFSPPNCDIKIDTVPYLGSVGTLSAYRRQGCTSIILQAVLDYHKTKSSESSEPIFLEVSEQVPNAMRLYNNFGFNFSTRLFQDDSKIPDDCKTVFEGEVFYLMSTKVAS